MKFTSAGLTHFGGIYLLHQFLQQLRIRSYLYHHTAFPQRNNRYSLSELLLALIYPMIPGLEKIEVSALLNTNGIFQYITGLPSFPNPVTLRRFLVRAAPSLLPQLQKVHDELRAHFLQYPQAQSSFWLDCDSTMHTLYGHQEGVVKGYNLRHRGKKDIIPWSLPKHISAIASPARSDRATHLRPKVFKNCWRRFSASFRVTSACGFAPMPASMMAILLRS